MTNAEAKEWIVKLISTMKEETSGMWADPQYKDEVYEALNEAIKALSVEPQEWISIKEAYTKGEWLFEPTQNINNPWKCSCCGHRAGRYKYKTYKFCPWCGAKMDKGGVKNDL